jgi:hypothetical protein
MTTFAENCDPAIAMLDALPAEELKPPRKFELYLMTATVLTETLCRVPPSHARDDLIFRLRDAIVRTVTADVEPTLQ